MDALTLLFVALCGASLWNFLQTAILNFDKFTTGGKNKTPQGQFLRQLISLGCLGIFAGLAFAADSTMGFWQAIVSAVSWYGGAFTWARGIWEAAARAPVGNPQLIARGLGALAYLAASVPALMVLGFFYWLWTAIEATFHDDEDGGEEEEPEEEEPEPEPEPKGKGKAKGHH